VFAEPVGPGNVQQFLQGADILVDGIDYFAFEGRRTLFRAAREAGMWSVTAGPVGFSTAWLSFDPQGMSFDRYFDFHDGMSAMDQFVAFTVGLAPRATHLPYFDFSYVDRTKARGPSLA